MSVDLPRMQLPFSKVHAQKVAMGLLVLIFLCIAALSITFRGDVADLLATVAQALYSPPALVYLEPVNDTTTFAIGETKTIDFNLSASVPVNSVGATLNYPKDMLEVVALSKERSFLTLWTQDTTIKESVGEISFSGGSTRHGGLTGTSTIVTITMRAKHEGSATLSVGHVEVYAADGKGTMVDTGDRPLTLSVTEPAPITGGVGSGAGGTTVVPPSPDINGDGKVTLLDASVMMVAIGAPYDTRYDFNMNGSVGLDDLSILFSYMSH